MSAAYEHRPRTRAAAISSVTRRNASGDAYTAETWIYDPSANTWSQVT